MTIVIRQCGSPEEDRLFGRGEIAALRPKMDLTYILIRYFMEDIQTALAGDGSAEAKTLWDRYEKLVPAMAQSMVEAAKNESP